MAEETRDPLTSTFDGEIDAALATLESALAAAGGAVVAIRDALPQIASLAVGVGEMEAAMARVRQQLGASSGVPPLRSVQPQVQLQVQPQVPQDTPAAPPEPETEPDDPPPSVEEEQTEAGDRVSHCLRLDVSTRASSLDLKAVDASVNENSAVVDVALLDYDGRRATLKIWIEASADPNAVREALLESLQRHLADDQEAEMRIDFVEEDPAA